MCAHAQALYSGNLGLENEQELRMLCSEIASALALGQARIRVRLPYLLWIPESVPPPMTQGRNIKTDCTQRPVPPTTPVSLLPGKWMRAQCMHRVLGHSLYMPLHGVAEPDEGVSAHRCMADSHAGRSTPSACCSAAQTLALRRWWKR